MKEKKLKDAAVFTVLSLLYPVYLFAAKEPETISRSSLFLALLFPVAGLIFSLNVRDARFKWGLSGINILIFFLFLYYSIVIIL